MFNAHRLCGALALAAAIYLPASAQEAAVSLSVTNGNAVLDLPKVPGTQEYKVLSTPDLNLGFGVLNSGSISGWTWSNAVAGNLGFFRAMAVPMPTNDMLAGLVLNRLAYGPTPDELERVKSIGADAYIAEQLAPETIVESLDIDQVSTNREWQRVVVTGVPTSKDFYIYLTDVGDVYIDDLKVVRGTDPDVGTSAFVNGDFETALSPSWTVSTNLSDSYIDTTQAHSGASSLHVIASSAGSTKASAIWQTTTATLNVPYTLSYWWKPGTNIISDAVLRFSGSGIVSSPDTIATKLALTASTTDDLRAWHVLHAVRSKKQLEEVLLQFLENHFVTQVSKTRDYFDQYYDGNDIDQFASRTEYNENQRWRAALENPSCTFSNLLKISAESVGQIIYLDTVNSRGDGSNIANENYARELLELYTYGVDNGYDQNDITMMSHAWTGWSTRIVDPTNEFNPFAVQSTTLRPGGTNVSNIENLAGVWAFNFKSGRHYVRSSTTIFPGKVVPDRFGAPWAGRSYELVLPIRTGTNGIQDGYDVIKHLCNQPFTEEFISVKLCRLFVHENFHHGYDFTDPNLSEEGKLVRACMLAWENSSPKGNVREVLKTIFNSDLFRSQQAVMHKVKTPLEFTVSAIRALRSENADGTATAQTDGYAIKDPINRMGSMKLFDRAEPNGYPEDAAPWISAGTLAERLRWVQALCILSSANGHADAGNSTTDPVALLKKKLSSAQWNDAAAVADYFLGILLPGEGKANLDLYRTAAINFLNTADNGTTSSPFASVGNTTTTYDTRVRGMVAAIMTSQRFHEQ
ncbi:MAG TPA: DUF1800 family protein [Verrucomicrobiae bacterium]